MVAQRAQFNRHLLGLQDFVGARDGAATHLTLVKATADDDALHAAPGLLLEKALNHMRKLQRVVF
ncbi:hypothetical protein D3C87_1993200 [compost metagenome]